MQEIKQLISHNHVDHQSIPRCNSSPDSNIGTLLPLSSADVAFLLWKHQKSWRRSSDSFVPSVAAPPPWTFPKEIHECDRLKSGMRNSTRCLQRSLNFFQYTALNMRTIKWSHLLWFPSYPIEFPRIFQIDWSCCFARCKHCQSIREWDCYPKFSPQFSSVFRWAELGIGIWFWWSRFCPSLTLHWWPCIDFVVFAKTHRRTGWLWRIHAVASLRILRSDTS